MFIFSLLIYGIFLIAYLSFFWALSYHLRNYQLPRERLPVVARAMVLAMMLLAAFSVVAFLAVPWDLVSRPSLSPMRSL